MLSRLAKIRSTLWSLYRPCALESWVLDDFARRLQAIGARSCRLDGPEVWRQGEEFVMANAPDADPRRCVCNLNRPVELQSFSQTTIRFEIRKPDDHILPSNESRLSAVWQKLALLPHLPDIEDSVFAEANFVSYSETVGVDPAYGDLADAFLRIGPGQADPYSLVVPEVGTFFLVVCHDPQLDLH